MSDSLKLLNLGCGRNFHSDWINLDLVPVSQEVQPADLSKGIPFTDGYADAVYHSHVLEHLTPDQGAALIAECFRVLRPGGWLRIAVPDLEQIARLYLAKLGNAWNFRDESSLADYSWMKLELIDQMVRNHSGGEMGKALVDEKRPNRSFLSDRLGAEVQNAEYVPQNNVKRPSMLSRTIARIKRKVGIWCFGPDVFERLREADFRRSGEIHQWMYDRVSLRDLVESAGFANFQICLADESQIAQFSKFELDAVDGNAKKPDSLFIECQKPAVAGVSVMESSSRSSTIGADEAAA